MRTRTGLLRGSVSLLLLSAAVFSACGSDDAKRKVDAQGGGAGESGAGQAEAGDPNAGGSSAAAPGAGGESAGGAGGASTGLAGGAAGGEAAEVATLAPFGLLFSVAPGAQGLAATGVADAAPDAASNLYESSGSGAAHVEGTNTLGYTAADLGVDAGDDIDAISIVHPAATSAFYFSIVDLADHAEGIDGTGVRRSSTSGEVKSDIFVSHALAPLNGNGSNIEWVDEFRLGLSPETEGEPSADDLNALDIGVPSGTTPVFFSVSPAAIGAVGSAVETVAADQVGCTIFSSTLDGSNEVAFTCAQLGLAANDDIDALVVLGIGDQPQTLLFSVTPSSVGVAATGVATQYGQGAADVFASDGTGGNVVYVEERALGLLDDDDLDALAVETGSDLAETWLAPPPENPPPAVPAACPWELADVRTNPGANLPVPHSLPANGSRVAPPSGRIRRTSSKIRRLSQADASRINALQPCNGRRTVTALPGSPPTRSTVFCPTNASPLTPGTYFIGVVETQEPLEFDAWQQVQVALIVDTDADAANNYAAGPVYTNDTFDNTDRVIQLQKSGNMLVARAQDISDNTFQDLSGVADRVIVQDNFYTFVMQVDEALPFPFRFTVFAANGGTDWSMSNVNLVGEPMALADVSSCF